MTTGVPSTILFEVFGVILIYSALFGELRRLPSAASRFIHVTVFSLMGVALVVGSFFEFHRLGGDNGVGIIVFVAAGLPLAALHLFQRARSLGTASWPTTRGTVETSDVKEVRTRNTHYFFAAIDYSYEINGEYYSGRFTKNFETESEASEYAETARAEGIVVRFNPAKTDHSCVLDKTTIPL